MNELILSGIRWEYLFDPQLALDSVPFVLEGLFYTLMISFVSFVLSLIGGTLIALMRLSNVSLLRALARLYTSFFRGVPVLVTLFFLYFGLPLVNLMLTAVQASIIGFGLTSSAYSSEIIRSAIESIDTGQWEAAQSLGLNQQRVLRKIIFPQATRVAIPALSNVLLDLVKGSSLTAMITVPEMFQKAKIVGGANNDYMTMYFLVAIIYWIITVFYGFLQDYLERHFSPDQSPTETSRLSA
ncbi:amino acid ABC transporter permease [Aerococcaceae bacterium WGS1372]